ncbi:4259_t:CDS:1, partial [Diversispora eburnea]
MPCYANTIVRVKFVKQYEKEKESFNFLVVWTLGTYPVERNDCEMEMTLFVPVNIEERDNETQAIFKKDSFYFVGEKIIPGFYNRNKRAKVL